jgi:hypothetical protein
MGNPVDQHYLDRMIKKDKVFQNIHKINQMEPGKRSKYLKQHNLTEDLLRQSVEGKEPALEQSFISSPWFAAMIPIILSAPIPMISSMLFGKGAGALAGLAGAGPITQEVAEFLGNLISVGSGNPSAEAQILKKYGAEEGPKILAKFQEIMAGNTEEKIGILEKITNPEVASTVEKTGEAVAKLSSEIESKIAGLFTGFDDSALRTAKGFVSKSMMGDLQLAQKTRANDLSKLLTMYKEHPEAQEHIAELISDEFVKYMELMTQRVASGVDKNGKTLYKVVKQEWTDESLDLLKKYIMKNDAIPVLDNLVNGSTSGIAGILGNEKGAVDMRLLTLAKSLLSTKNIYKAEANALLMDPSISGRKALTDLMYLPFQRLTQSIALAAEHRSLDAGQMLFVSAMRALKESFPEAVRLAKATFKSGMPEFEVQLEKELETVGKMHPEVSKKVKQALTYGLDAYDKTPIGLSQNYLASAMTFGSRSIRSADQLAKTMAYRSSLFMFAYHHALQEVEGLQLKGMERFQIAEELAKEYMANPPDWLLSAQVEDMFKSTFTDSNAVIKAFNAAAIHVPQLRIMFPFFNTPINLYRHGLEMTPAGLGMSLLDEPGLERNTTLVKSVLGSIFAIYIAHEVQQGNITGGHQQNPNNNYKIHGWGYRHLGPFGTYLALIADAAQYYTNAKPQDQNVLADAIGRASLQSINHAPMMNEITNFVKAYTSVGDKGGWKIFENYMGQKASEFIPAPVKIAADVLDPVYRETQSALDVVKSNLPYYSKTLPPYRHWDGTPQYLPPGVNANDTPPDVFSILMNKLSPIGTGHIEEMDNVDKTLGQLGIKFNRPPDHIKIAGQIIPIDPNLRDLWSTTSGEGQREAFDSLINSDNFQNFPEHQTDMIKVTHAQFYLKGKAAVQQYITNIASNPEDLGKPYIPGETNPTPETSEPTQSEPKLELGGGQ